MTLTKTNKTYTMAQLRASKRSLFIKNDTIFLFTLHEKVGNGQKIDIELRPCGQRGSITYLPPAALDAPGIARNLNRKITISPDLEEEMIALEDSGAEGAKKLLSQFQIELQESPNARAIDVKDQVKNRLDQVTRKRSITPQGQQGGSMIDEFINPSPIRADDGTVRNAMTGEIVTTSEVSDNSTVADLVGKVTLTQPRRLEEN